MWKILEKPRVPWDFFDGCGLHSFDSLKFSVQDISFLESVVLIPNKKFSVTPLFLTLPTHLENARAGNYFGFRQGQEGHSLVFNVLLPSDVSPSTWNCTKTKK